MRSENLTSFFCFFRRKMEIVFCYNINETDISQKNVVILFFLKEGARLFLRKKV